MKFGIIILILILLIFNLELVSADENEYGIVKAWFNEKNATAETIQGIKLKIGEPAEVKIDVISKIEGHVFVKLKEPGVTKAYDILNGPSAEDEYINNYNIANGWSKTFIWTIKPNGAWKNGNAPINIMVSYYNIKKDFQKPIQFTIANPYILDEQYSGAIPTPVTTTSPAGTQTKEAPFVPVIFAVGALLVAWRWRREES